MHDGLPLTCVVCAGTCAPLNGQHGAAAAYWRCGRCGHVSLAPLPTPGELAAYYNAQYRVPRDRQRAAAARNAAWALTALRRHLPAGGHVLEVGCSYGDVLAQIAAAGFRATGLEMDDRAAAAARAAGLSVRTGAVPEDLPDGPVDAVLMSHVLEHLPDGPRALAGIAERLAPGGVLLLRTPNAGALAARLLGAYWEWCAVPEHVQLYTAESLTQCLAGAGFRPVVRETSRGDAHPLAVEVALGLARTARRRRSGGGVAAAAVPLTHRPAFRHTASAVGRLTAPLDRLVAAAGRGEELRVVAVREPATPRGA